MPMKQHWTKQAISTAVSDCVQMVENIFTTAAAYAAYLYTEHSWQVLARLSLVPA